MKTKTNYRIETYIYLVLWTLLFITPIVSLYIHTVDYSEEFSWHEVLLVWSQYAIFLIVFLIHNYLLAPLLVYQKRRTLYFSIMALLVAVFCLVQCSGWTKPHEPSDQPPMHANHQQPPHERPHFEDDGFERDGFEGDAFEHDGFEGDAFERDGFNDPHRPPMFDPVHEDFHRPPLIFGEHDVVSIIVMLLMLGANLGIKGYFKHRNDEKQYAELEKEKLEQQLEYLKYQINPHFLMNTLNNIHALVDIEPEEAKESIVTLSKILRFVLYEGSKQTVPLERELQFMQDYIKLMRQRVSADVPIRVTIDDQAPGHHIPPLLLITFVENAFKHGISYNQPSFIDIAAHTSADRFIFTCSNSKVTAPDDKAQGGIGLQNIKKRLDLIYGKNYTLTIDDGAASYNIKLDIPL